MIKKILSFLIIVSFFACGTSKKMKETEQIIWVNSYRIQCNSETSAFCLQYQVNENAHPGQWKPLQSKIGNFEYKEGYLYQLKVYSNTIEGEQFFDLKEIISEKLANKTRLHDIWFLEEMGGKPITNIAPGNGRPRIEMMLPKQRILGNDGCNEIRGKLILVGEERLEIGTLAGTKKLCPDIKNPEIFKGMLLNTKFYEIKNLHLYLMDQQGKTMLKFKKGD